MEAAENEQFEQAQCATTADLKRPVNVGDLSRSESVSPVIVRGGRRSAGLIQRLPAASATASRKDEE